jgi:hypothetical protein
MMDCTRRKPARAITTPPPFLPAWQLVSSEFHT